MMPSRHCERPSGRVVLPGETCKKKKKRLAHVSRCEGFVTPLRVFLARVTGFLQQCLPLRTFGQPRECLVPFGRCRVSASPDDTAKRVNSRSAARVGANRADFVNPASLLPVEALARLQMVKNQRARNVRNAIERERDKKGSAPRLVPAGYLILLFPAATAGARGGSDSSSVRTSRCSSDSHSSGNCGDLGSFDMLATGTAAGTQWAGGHSRQVRHAILHSAGKHGLSRLAERSNVQTSIEGIGITLLFLVIF